ncbi:alpha/beta hydrolase [Pyxidicoccus parkwayensis]|uniref:Alpha/beta hydrolase n=1 Tax=Pyxidicoccus parkwayensis TaxID=2813578 RepID=A0ABX7NT22_9BACT|nr:alpha/beta hydrolase [Pyxidicoccus parkwaysis]QSQ22031.1 alpha/beta hydrolase [Pyxidicoccus parkwaysis]
MVARGRAGCLKGGHILEGPVLRTGACVAVGLCLLLWSGRGGAASLADAGTIAAPRTEDVTFQSGDSTLAGTLWLPSGAAPRAAVVLLPDEAPGTREALEPYPAFLVQQGLAVLAYDRRGAGRSSGDAQPWVSGIREWADDGLAAAKLLRERTGVRDVGLMGFGQGAWVAIHAAARAPELGFLVLVSGGGGSLWKQEEHRLRNEARNKGLTGPEVVDLMEHLDALHDARLYSPDREAKALKTLDFQLKRAKRRRWYAVSPLSRFGDMPLPRLLVVRRAAWNNVLSYDSTEDLSRVRIPVLALLGEADAVTPTQSVARALSQGLPRDAGTQAPTVTVKVLRGADHQLARPPETKPAEDAFHTLEEWLRERGALLQSRGPAE